MSKAFTRESDSEVEDDVPAPRSALPPGARNYLTPNGARRMQDELKRWVEEERPALAASKDDDDEAARQLRRLDARIREMTQLLESAEIVPPPAGAADQVQFGATVTVRDEEGEELQYRIVGVDEVDFDKGWVSWASPIARTLMKARAGDRVALQSPGGERRLRVVAVSYENENA